MSNNASVQFDPVFSARVLPRCWSCGAQHPLSLTPPKDEKTCHACGQALPALSSPVVVPAVITGKSRWLWLAALLFRIAKKLRKD